jgi:hypothetical protein
MVISPHGRLVIFLFSTELYIYGILTLASLIPLWTALVTKVQARPICQKPLVLWRIMKVMQIGSKLEQVELRTVSIGTQTASQR